MRSGTLIRPVRFARVNWGLIEVVNHSLTQPFKPAKSGVASVTENPSDSSRRIIVVDANTANSREVHATDGTAVALRCLDSVTLIESYAMPVLGVATKILRFRTVGCETLGDRVRVPRSPFALFSTRFFNVLVIQLAFVCAHLVGISSLPILCVFALAFTAVSSLSPQGWRELVRVSLTALRAVGHVFTLHQIGGDARCH